ATDWVYTDNAALFQRGPDTGRTIAVVGAGPAGLSCAHALARAGHRVSLYDAQPKPGGLNEYGIAAYKVPGFAQREIDWLLSIGGITLELGCKLGDNLALADLRRDYDAVFLGLGLAGVNALGIADEAVAGVRNAVDFIAQLRQCTDLAQMPVGRRVVVIGGGNTAIDAAVQSKKLGAEVVTLVYRRGTESMSATPVEQAFAQTEGVAFIKWAQPKRIVAVDGTATGVEFEYTQLDDGGRLMGSGDRFVVAADLVLKAVGQALVPVAAGAGGELLAVDKGRIVVNADYETSLPGVYAGGDCVGGKVDLTVQSVEDGKRAAQAIHRAVLAKAAKVAAAAVPA
ncbi:MAG TPA: FAD-dependent oxidoreductase, partial [Tahibacter sp.]|nr:FAD-dependent oxidoreductase [Tahibacter sp.]